MATTAPDFSALKKSSQLGELSARLNEQLDNANEAAEKPRYQEDPLRKTEWKPTANKDGSGRALIRFLPPLEDGPCIATFTSYFIKKMHGGRQRVAAGTSLRTIDQRCPILKYKGWMKNSGKEELNVFQKKSMVLTTRYVANILVVKDWGDPENDGKVFKYIMGNTIYKMIDRARKGYSPSEAEDEEEMMFLGASAKETRGKEVAPIDVFNMWEGADLLLKFENDPQKNMRTYEPSRFGEPTPLHDAQGTPYSEKEMEKIWLSQHDLTPYVDETTILPYEEQEKKLLYALGWEKQSPFDAEGNYVGMVPSRTAPVSPSAPSVVRGVEELSPPRVETPPTLNQSLLDEMVEQQRKNPSEKSVHDELFAGLEDDDEDEELPF